MDVRTRRTTLEASISAWETIIRASRLTKGQEALEQFDRLRKESQLAIFAQQVGLCMHISAELVPIMPLTIFEGGGVLERQTRLTVDSEAFRIEAFAGEAFAPSLLSVGGVIICNLVYALRARLASLRVNLLDRVDAQLGCELNSGGTLVVIHGDEATAEFGLLRTRERIECFSNPPDQRLLRVSGPHRIIDQAGAAIIDRAKLN